MKRLWWHGWSLNQPGREGQSCEGFRTGSMTKFALGLTVALSALGGFLAPAFADTYTAGAAGHNVASVGTNGSSADYADVAVSQGGCAYGAAIAVALGESGCGYDASAPVAVGLLGADSRSGSVNDPVFAYPWIEGIAASDTGDADRGGAVSGSGRATGFYAVSGDDASAQHGGVAMSLTGDAYAERTTAMTWQDGTTTYPTFECERFVDYRAPAVSGTGNANGCTAVAPLGAAGGATAIGGSYAQGKYIAVSPTGRADASGGGEELAVGLGDSSVDRGLACVSVTGNCYGGLVSVALLGGASARSYRFVGPTLDEYPPTVAIAGGDAYADRGLATVSLTGNACGASVYSLAPMGHAC